jgi:hypothetical protein
MILASSAMARQQRGNPSISRQETQRLLSSGLHSAAQLRGAINREDGYPPTRLENLGELGDIAETVFVGTVDSNSCRPTLDDSTIVTVYEVAVESVLKGQIPGGQSKTHQRATIAVLGGRVNYPDGASAQITVPHFHMPLNGERLMWFVRRAQPNYLGDMNGVTGPLYTLAGGPLGVYDLTADRSPFVLPAANYGSPIALHLHEEKLNGDAFIAEMQSVLKR